FGFILVHLRYFSVEEYRLVSIGAPRSSPISMHFHDNNFLSCATVKYEFSKVDSTFDSSENNQFFHLESYTFFLQNMHHIYTSRQSSQLDRHRLSGIDSLQRMIKYPLPHFVINIHHTISNIMIKIEINGRSVRLHKPIRPQGHPVFLFKHRRGRSQQGYLKFKFARTSETIRHSQNIIPCGNTVKKKSSISRPP